MYRCHCGKDAEVIYVQGHWYLRCSEHVMEIRVGDAIRLAEVEEVYDEIPKGIDNSLRNHNVPLCIGQMQKRKTFTINDTEALPEEDSMELALSYHLADLADLAGAHIGQIINCTQCVLFDRCKVLSGLGR